MAARKAPARTRVSRAPAPGKARVNGGPAKTSLKGEVAKGAGPTKPGKDTKPSLKAPAVTKGGPGTIAQRANAAAARRAGGK